MPQREPKTRIYMLNGEEIPASYCDGFLHIQKLRKVSTCYRCGLPTIYKGDLYVKAKDGRSYLHFECAEFPAIFGVRNHKEGEIYYVMCIGYDENMRVVI